MVHDLNQIFLSSVYTGFFFCFCQIREKEFEENIILSYVYLYQKWGMHWLKYKHFQIVPNFKTFIFSCVTNYY